MQSTTVIARTAASLGLVMLTLACGKADVRSAEAAAPAALSVSNVAVGRGLNADKTLKDETGTFAVRDTIYAVVKTEGASAGASINAKWTFQDGQTVSESSLTVAPTGGESRHEFHLQKATAWPKGNYKVEITLNGTPAGSKDFRIM